MSDLTKNDLIVGSGGEGYKHVSDFVSGSNAYVPSTSIDASAHFGAATDPSAVTDAVSAVADISVIDTVVEVGKIVVSVALGALGLSS